MDKIEVNIFVPTIDNNFDVVLPINLEMKTVVEELQKSINELSNGAYVINQQAILYDKNTGCLINLNNIVKYSGLKNGSSVLLF